MKGVGTCDRNALVPGLISTSLGAPMSEICIPLGLKVNNCVLMEI